ncbi:MAG: precorrin-6A/cobalt-precorrin-6A reductase [Pseudomonadota bacterium]
MRLLLLAGTSEAVQVGHALARDSRVRTVASLPYPTREPGILKVPQRIGGWQDAVALESWVRETGVGAVLDMSHPFSTKITGQCAEICDRLGIPFVQFMRSSLVPGRGDNWVFLNSEKDVAERAPDKAAIFLATGRHRLPDFVGLGDRPIYVRVRELLHDRFPFPNGRYVHRPTRPSVSTEVEGLKSFDVSWIVARNTGGAWTQPTLDAARVLGIQVGMIRRPRQPEVPRVHSIAEALGWVRRQL